MMKKYLLLTFLFIGFYAQAQEKINLVLNVFNEFTNDNISFADIKMINNTTNQRVFKKTNFNGNISIDLFPNMSYKLTVTSVSDSNIVVFKEKSLDFDTKGIQAGTNIEYNVKLRPVFQKGGLQFIQDLQFNIFKYTLNKENEIILENVLELLQKHPEINLEVNAYAACNLSEDDANSVSVERAKAVVFYLTGKGIDYQRIKAAAWGKEQSITKCTCKPQKPKDKECSKRELLAESPLIGNTNWEPFAFKFEPKQTHTHITFEAFYKTPVLFPYNGNILVDNASEIVPMPCDEEPILAKMPEVQVTNPANGTPETINTDRFTVNAMVENIDKKSDIKFKLNGKASLQTEYKFLNSFCRFNALVNTRYKGHADTVFARIDAIDSTR